jgi:hypothetical protein
MQGKLRRRRTRQQMEGQDEKETAAFGSRVGVFLHRGTSAPGSRKRTAESV